MSDSSLRGTIRYGLVEIVIVTIGILIAFSLDSWWQGRQDHAREAVYLVQLRSDFTMNLETLRDHEKRESRIEEGALAVLRMVHARPRPSSADVSRELYRVFSSSRPVLFTGTYQTLVSTGDLALLSDESLRGELGTFASLIASNYSERFEDDNYQQLLRDWSGKLNFMSQFSMDALQKLEIPTPVQEADPSPLLDDPRFVDQLLSRFSISNQVSRHYKAAGDRAQAVLDRLGAPE